MSETTLTIIKTLGNGVSKPMRYRPVHISHIYERTFERKSRKLIKETDYFAVFSTMLGRCGHKHRMEAATKPCFERMKKEWARRRSRQMREAWAQRKATEALKRVSLPSRDTSNPIPVW